MERIHPGFLLVLWFMFAASVLPGADGIDFPQKLRLQWQHIENQYHQRGMHLGRLTIINHGNVPLPVEGWALYFNWYRKIVPAELDSRLSGRHINGDFYISYHTGSCNNISTSD